MPSTAYSRTDFAIEIAAHDDDGATIAWTSPDQMVTGRQRVTADAIARWTSGMNPLADLPSLQAALAEWAGAHGWPANAQQLNRVTLDIADRDLSRLSWESHLRARVPMGSAAIVRVSRTRSRALAFPLTLPLRMVEIGAGPDSALRATVLNVFGGNPPEQVEQAIRIATVLPDHFPPRGWPSVDVLHCDAVTLFVDSSLVLSLERPASFGTLGWFLRTAEQYQTRLVVIHCATPADAERARALGAAIVRRGGPAVLVGDFAPSVTALSEYSAFYWNLIHDFPLDFALFPPLQWLPVLDPRSPTLFVGGGREDALRVSAIGAALVELRRKLQQQTQEVAAQTRRRRKEANPARTLLYVQDLLKRSKRPLSTSIEIATKLEPFEAAWETTIKFDLHEHEGILPVAGALRTARGSAGVSVDAPVAWTGLQRVQVQGIPRRSLGRPIRIPKTYARIVGRTPAARAVRRTRAAPPIVVRETPAAPPQAPPSAMPPSPAPARDAAAPTAPAPRFLNASLWRDVERGGVERLPATECLERGRIYQLGAQIGPRDSLLVTIGAAAILEEVFKFSPESAGVWVEVGVAGLDFEVLGDPVQELWLPRDGASDIAYFPIRTDKPGWARLRLCLYFKNTVVQSLRLGAVVTEPGGASPAPAVRGERLAAALGSAKLGAATDAGHAARLEYNLAVPVEALENRPAPAVAIVANHLDGQPAVTVKGGDDRFETRINNDLPRHVSAVRDAMHDVSFIAVDDVEPERYPYRFGFGVERNRGTDAEFSAALQTLAKAGWQLFTATFSPKVRAQLIATLSRTDQIILVAHILLEKTIPWAAVYDRLFDPGRTVDEQGTPVRHGVCLAALNPDGTFRATECGPHKDAHPDCVLHAANIAKARAAGDPVPHVDTIACPLHFWGFRHIIELPAQQLTETEDDARPQATEIHAGASAQMIAGFNLTLKQAPKHREEIDDILTAKGVSAVWKEKASVRDQILKSLKDRGLHAVYFYCHARGGTADPKAFPPYLEFQNNGAAGQITSDLLDVKPDEIWTQAPLVILNGCGTAGFSPDALSPFVKTLVQDRGASGVVGAEIAIAEPLAAEAAVRFLTAFLSGTRAGEAMLGMRRALLMKNNPLGLVYVLYSAADLKVVYDAAGG